MSLLVLITQSVVPTIESSNVNAESDELQPVTMLVA